MTVANTWNSVRSSEHQTLVFSLSKCRIKVLPKYEVKKLCLTNTCGAVKRRNLKCLKCFWFGNCLVFVISFVSCLDFLSLENDCCT